eukprot:CAMPEP_0172866842 /NCGR_PEP_ID=MMETSP1075-20121228/82201_1 /TAXON_ID=2916 /ORGANISM="Ceratium fusus, Strain PA161109" /LENGTH=149 /DNA_ID=CAMNT_0013716051 /DNA_START=1457 /DNA_END=1907 /DNA_ORIENTATION=-
MATTAPEGLGTIIVDALPDVLLVTGAAVSKEILTTGFQQCKLLLGSRQQRQQLSRGTAIGTPPMQQKSNNREKCATTATTTLCKNFCTAAERVELMGFPPRAVGSALLQGISMVTLQRLVERPPLHVASTARADGRDNVRIDSLGMEMS